MLRAVSLLRRPPEHDPEPDLDLLGSPPHELGTLAEPRFRGPLEAIFLHPLLAIAPVVLLVAAAVVAGLGRTPVHTAEARINVGRADVPAYTLQGTTIGNSTLAASYARAVPAAPVVIAAAKAGRTSLAVARAALTGSPVPGSTLIRVDADADSSRQAQAMANAAARSLITYVVELNGRQRPRGLVTSYRRAQRRTDDARNNFERLSRRLPKSSPAVESARLDLLAAQLRSQALSTRVLQSRVTPAVPNQLQLIQPATSSTSDRRSMLGRLALIGLAAGIVLGIGLALLRANADLLRAHRERVRRAA
jgi:capsular polysaccharide biosynthesis protein